MAKDDKPEPAYLKPDSRVFDPPVKMGGRTADAIKTGLNYILKPLGFNGLTVDADFKTVSPDAARLAEIQAEKMGLDVKHGNGKLGRNSRVKLPAHEGLSPPSQPNIPPREGGGERNR